MENPFKELDQRRGAAGNELGPYNDQGGTE